MTGEYRFREQGVSTGVAVRQDFCGILKDDVPEIDQHLQEVQGCGARFLVGRDRILDFTDFDLSLRENGLSRLFQKGGRDGESETGDVYTSFLMRMTVHDTEHLERDLLRVDFLPLTWLPVPKILNLQLRKLLQLGTPLPTIPYLPL